MEGSSASSSDIIKQNVLTAAKGTSITFTGSLFAYIIRFVMGILLARILGAERFGLYDLALTTIFISGSVASIGLMPAVVRYVSVFASRKDTEGVWGTLQVGIGVPFALSVFVGIGLYALAIPIAHRLFDEPRLVPLLRLSCLTLPFLLLSRLLAAATRGFKKMQYSVIALEISHSVIKLVFVAALAIVGLSAMGALAAHTITLIIVCAMLVYFLNKLFSLKRPLRSARRDAKEMLRFALPIYLSNLIITFRSNLQSILLGAIHTVESVGIFSVTNRVALVGMMVNNSVVTTAMPIVSELYDRGQTQQLGHFYQTMTKWTLMLNLPIFLIAVLFPKPILSIFGQGYVDGSAALAILSWATLINAATCICGVLIDMTGNTHLQTLNTVITTVLGVGLNFRLVPSFGIIGAAWAALGSTAIIGFIRLLEVYILFRLLPYNASFIKPVAAGVVALAATLVADWLLPSRANLAYTIINAIFLVVVYIATIMLLGISQEDRLVLTRLRMRVGSMLSRR